MTPKKNLFGRIPYKAVFIATWSLILVGLLTLAGLFSVGFLVGQFLAWQELKAAGFYAVFSAAATFFMLLTALHAIHLVGGLLVWSRATWRAWQGMEVKRLRLSVELCTTYWHYLLLVWFVFFTLLLST